MNIYGMIWYVEVLEYSEDTRDSKLSTAKGSKMCGLTGSSKT